MANGTARAVVTQDLRTRDRLIEVAAEMFADRGLEKTTVREICAAAGANVAAVNYHFGGKDGLYHAVIQTAIRVMRETNGNKVLASRKLCITRTQLYGRLRKYGLEAEADRIRDESRLSNPTNATIADGQGVGTINNDDTAPSFSINDVQVTEGNSGTSTATFTVTKSGATEPPPRMA